MSNFLMLEALRLATKCITDSHCLSICPACQGSTKGPLAAEMDYETTN
jgi:hypothetical protein